MDVNRNVLWLMLIYKLSLGFADDLLVKVKDGTIRGHFLVTPNNNTFKAFQGIPFAAPPLGSLRFQAPHPPLPWEGILETTQDSNVCYVIESDSPDESEDCLYLNVFTPLFSKENETRVPVLLCIHGGGYSHGSSLYSNLGPDYLIETGIIIVTINYRLGPFGFLATDNNVIPGNAGHKDQAAAIRWTNENIARFGGDPEQITIVGQSAGGSSVGYQLLYKKNEGLFRAAILQSGSPLSPWSFMDSNVAKQYAFDLAKQINSSVNLQNDTTMLRDFLVNADAQAIDSASTRTTISRPLPVMEPDHEEAFLTKEPYELLKAGDFIRVPIIIGTNSEEEIHRAADLANLEKYLNKYESSPESLIPNDFKVKSEVSSLTVGNSIKDLYWKNVSDDNKLGHVVRYLSHTSFTTPMIKHADLASNFTDVFFYVFSYDGLLGNVNVTIKGADKIDHGEECKYLWKKEGSGYSNSDLSQYPKADVLTLERLISLWSNFVKYLNPTTVKSELLQNITWPKFVQGEYKFIDIGRNLEVKINPKSPYYKAWSQFYEDWAEKPFTTF